MCGRLLPDGDRNDCGRMDMLFDRASLTPLLLETLFADGVSSPTSARFSSWRTLLLDLAWPERFESLVEADTCRLWLPRRLGPTLRERVEDDLLELPREFIEESLLASSSFPLCGIPSHFELTLGTCSGILKDDTPDIPGGFTRPGCSAICFRD
jgi:hypothetical protein